MYYLSLFLLAKSLAQHQHPEGVCYNSYKHEYDDHKRSRHARRLQWHGGILNDGERRSVLLYLRLCLLHLLGGLRIVVELQLHIVLQVLEFRLIRHEHDF